MVVIGICLRDSTGEFVIAKIDFFYPLCDVDIEEDVGSHTTLNWIACL